MKDRPHGFAEGVGMGKPEMMKQTSACDDGVRQNVEDQNQDDVVMAVEDADAEAREVGRMLVAYFDLVGGGKEVDAGVASEGWRQNGSGVRSMTGQLEF